ncbi:MAG: DNA polymerase I [Fuerstiella sp.]|nr:DNA polymerase I [Fuerstiella sp.]
MPDMFATNRLFLLDAMALIYRAHFALIRAPRYTSGGTCTSAVFGVTNTLLDILKKEEPTHIAVAFDTQEPTYRHKEYPEYKAQRDTIPEDIVVQFPWVDRLFDAMNMTTIRIPGFEADDIIGTLASEAEGEDFDTWMVTPDKDYHQLVTERTVVYKPGRQGSNHEIMGVRQVLDNWQIESVEQVIDILALMGDSSDNIPGIPGIGPKTAQKLIAQYGSLEELLSHTDQLKGKQKERVEENTELALLSKRLVTIVRDVPHDIQFDDLAVRAFDDDKLKALFEELEFDTVGKRVFGQTFSSSQSRQTVIREKREKEIQKTLFDEEEIEVRTLKEVPHEYHTVTTAKDRTSLIRQLSQQPTICFDTETTGLNPREALPLGLAFSIKPHEAWYVVCPDDAEDIAAVLEEFRPLFENEKITKTGHNLKYDISLLKWHGIDVRGPLMDTMLAHSMIEPEMAHGLDYLAELYLGYRPVSTSQLIGEKGKDQKNMRDVPLESLAEYACEDADVTWQVAEALKRDIEERGVSQVCFDVECPLIPVLVDMEHEGIRLDADALVMYSGQLEQEIGSLQQSIYATAGEEFNIASPKQLGVVLFENLQLIDNPKKTATGQYSTKEAELLRLAPKHQIVQDVLEYRNAVKLKSVYVDQLPESVNPETGRVHTHYSQAWTATGRMQSANPNLQTIPIRKQRGREIRAAFVPRDDDYLTLSADYSQIELRVMAELSGDEAMKQAFIANEDIHQITASKVYKVDPNDVTREMRDKAKTVNFGIIYGISAFGLQQRLNIPRTEARELIDNYFDKYPGVRTWIDSTIEFAREHGYVRTQSGRRRYLRDIDSRNNSLRSAAERLAMNSPIQGTAADLLKLAMIRVHTALKNGGFQTKMLLTVHDEIVFDMKRDEEKTVIPVIRECMTSALPMSVPVVVDTGVGNNWLEAH